MSNASIAARLSDEIAAYARGERTSEQFCLTLCFSVEAMERLSQEKIQEHASSFVGFRERSIGLISKSGSVVTRSVEILQRG
jgi:hypothetical protein